MSFTESDLWSSVKTEGLTRIESGGTQTGISDIEYVLAPWHGWIEMKVAYVPARKNKPLRFRHPLQYDQLGWLIKHHKPGNYLRSWVLVGLASLRAVEWRGFLLVAPPQAVHILEGREKPYEDLIESGAVKLFVTAESVINWMKE